MLGPEIERLAGSAAICPAVPVSVVPVSAVAPVTVTLAVYVKDVPPTVTVTVTGTLVFGSVTVVCTTPLAFVIAIDGEKAPLLVVLSVNGTPIPWTVFPDEPRAATASGTLVPPVPVKVDDESVSVGFLVVGWVVVVVRVVVMLGVPLIAKVTESRVPSSSVAGTLCRPESSVALYRIETSSQNR